MTALVVGQFEIGQYSAACREHYRRHTMPVASSVLLAIVVSVASIGAGAVGTKYWWLFLLVAACALFVGAWNVFDAPAVRKWRLRRPAHAHFTNRNPRQALSGRDVSKGDPHYIRRLVLQSGQVTLIEIGYWPRVPFHLNELIVSVGGDFSARPRILERTDQYVQSGAKPPTTKDYFAGDVYHAHFDLDRNVGTHRVIGFKLKTKKAGLYPIRLDFITNEISGSFEGLEILVEDNPTTLMHCHAKKVENHGRNCLVSPVDLPAPTFPASPPHH